MVHRDEYRKRLVAISNYMQKFKVPSMVQERVKLWLQYTWEHQKIFDENKVLSFLPPKMRTDLALKVHYATLSKVKLFQDCDTGLLKELVTKLRPMIFLPGDYICRKDDIGREMYIVQSGYVMVMTPNVASNNGNRIIMATLGEGSVFGEIALLGISGMSRRTADVVSKGFSNLFILRKDDLEEALQHFPDAKRILNAKARKIMKENDERNATAKDENKVLKKGDFVPKYTPKNPTLIETVLELKRRQRNRSQCQSSLGVSTNSVLTNPKYLFTDSESDLGGVSEGGLGANSSTRQLAPLSRRTSLASTSIGYMTDTQQDSQSNVVTDTDEQTL